MLSSLRALESACAVAAIACGAFAKSRLSRELAVGMVDGSAVVMAIDCRSAAVSAVHRGDVEAARGG